MAKNCAKIGVNLRVTETGHQGGRKHMEDTYAVHFERNPTTGQAEFAYFAIFDGHGGVEASNFAKSHLLAEITKYDYFWNNDDTDVMQAIKLGFLDTHKLMAKELDNWPKTLSGFPSTSGTTASIAIIKYSKLYIGHVGDSGVALGFQGDHSDIHALMLTKDHKPECPEERKRIEECGGEVVSKAGVQRVVWNRPKLSHKGPIRRSTVTDKIPFLAVARSLGDLWSFNLAHGDFIISPLPDVSVHSLLPKNDKCLILGSDGLWNMLTPLEAVMVVVENERKFDQLVVNDIFSPLTYWNNPAEHLVNYALQKWNERMLKADNTTCVIVMIDTMGPSKLERLRRRREERILQLSKQQKLSMDINAYLKYHLLPGANGQNAAANLVGLSSTDQPLVCANVQRKSLPIAAHENSTRTTRPLSLNDTNQIIVNNIRTGSQTKKLNDAKIESESPTNKSDSASPEDFSLAGATPFLDSSKEESSDISICKETDIENEIEHRPSKSKMRFSICLSGDESEDSRGGNDTDTSPVNRCVETGEIDHNANLKDDDSECSENKDSTSASATATVDKKNSATNNNHNVDTLPRVRRRLSLRPKMLRTRTEKSLDDVFETCDTDPAKSTRSKSPTPTTKTTRKTSNGRLDFRERIAKRFLSPHLVDTQNITENSGPHLRSSNNSQKQHSRTSISDDESSHKLNEKSIRKSSENSGNPARPSSFNCMQFPSQSKEEKCPAEKTHVLKRFFAWQQQLMNDHKASRNLRYSKRKRDSGVEASVENLSQKRSCRLNLRFSNLHSKKELRSSRVKVDS